jgi:hypothetical protein
MIPMTAVAQCDLGQPQCRLQARVDLLHERGRQLANHALNVCLRNAMEAFAADRRVVQ